jgi:hypothetical protein
MAIFTAINGHFELKIQGATCGPTLTSSGLMYFCEKMMLQKDSVCLTSRKFLKFKIMQKQKILFHKLN